MFEVTLIEAKPMELPNIRCPNCGERVPWSPEHMTYKYGPNEPLWRCKPKDPDEKPT
jgi:DNA-directed RNA polymerase subunit RPC12/RpoP